MPLWGRGPVGVIAADGAGLIGEIPFGPAPRAMQAHGGLPAGGVVIARMQAADHAIGKAQRHGGRVFNIDGLATDIGLDGGNAGYFGPRDKAHQVEPVATKPVQEAAAAQGGLEYPGCGIAAFDTGGREIYG